MLQNKLVFATIEKLLMVFKLFVEIRIIMVSVAPLHYFNIDGDSFTLC